MPSIGTLATRSTRLALTLSLAAAGGVLVAGPAPLAPASPMPVPSQAADDRTEDVVHLTDGRVFRGEVVNETSREVTFKFRDADLGMTVTLTFPREQVEKLERGVPVEGDPMIEEDEAEEDPVTMPTRSSKSASEEREEAARTYGAMRSDPSNPNASRFYIVPMTGTMGTDIHVDVYREMVDDIRAKNPDYIVVVMDCEDHQGKLEGSEIIAPEQGDFNIPGLDMYRELVHLFHNELGDIPQVLWVEDSVGVSSIIALAWEDIYMKPGAKLAGVAKTAVMFERVRADANMYGKFREAFMALFKGFAEFGDLDLKVVDAMVRPEMTLSASWKGREVEWELDESGEYLVDGSKNQTVEFRADTAEDLIISDGTVDTLDDLALLLGVREYAMVDSEAQRIFDRYVESWRRVYEQCETELMDFQQYMGWANGADTLKYLGRAKSSLEKIVASMRRYDAVAHRLAETYGITELALVIQIEQIKEQIKALNRGGRGGGGGGVGGGGRGLGGRG